MNKEPQGVAPEARNWTEDFQHENGDYLCRCMDCSLPFRGHKRRVQCKLCATVAPEPLCVCGHRKGTHWPECQVSAYNSCPCNAFRPAQPANEAEPASAQAISAEAATAAANFACHHDLALYLEDPLAIALTAHAAQEVSRVEGAYKAELAGRHVGYKATCKTLEEAQSQLAQLAQIMREYQELNTERVQQIAILKETLAQVEWERDDMQRARDLEQQSVGNLITQVSALTAERDALRAQVGKLALPECKVCGNKMNQDGMIDHGRGCYQISQEGGGSEDASCEAAQILFSTLQPKGQE